MAIYDLYEIQAESITEARDLIQRLLSLQFREHDRSYHRGPYFSAEQGGGECFKIERNLDPYEDVPNEDEFPDVKFLLYVDDTKRSEELYRIFSASDGRVNHLRHEEL